MPKKSGSAEKRKQWIERFNDVLRQNNPNPKVTFADIPNSQNIQVIVFTKTGANNPRYGNLILTALRAAGLISGGVDINSKAGVVPQDTEFPEFHSRHSPPQTMEQFLDTHAGKHLEKTTIRTGIKLDDFIQGKFNIEKLNEFEHYLTHPEEAHTVSQERAATEREYRAESKRKLMAKKEADKAAKKEAENKKKPQKPDDRLEDAPELKESKPRSRYQGRNGK